MDERIYEVEEREDFYMSQPISSLLMNISKWTRFLSILGFIFLGIMAICILTMGAFLSSLTNYVDLSNSYSYYTPNAFRWFHILFYLLMLLIYFFPIYFLYQFSVRIKRAVTFHDESAMTHAFQFLNKYFMYIGVLAIIAMVFFIFAFIGLVMTFFAYL